MDDAQLQEAKKATQSLLAKVDGVQGVGLGDGTVRVYIDREETRHLIPETVKDVPVEIVITGGISAF